MKPKAGIIFKFLIHNAWPKSHVTTAPRTVTPLIYHICKGREVDVARIISRELKHIALGGAVGAETRLCFSGFIMGLIRHHEVQIPNQFPKNSSLPLLTSTFGASLPKRQLRVQLLLLMYPHLRMFPTRTF